MLSSSDLVWWKRRPLLAALAVACCAAWAVLAVELRGAAPQGPDRATYEGHGGELRWLGSELVLPDLAPEPAGSAEPAAVLRLRGRPWSEAVALLGRSAMPAVGGIQAWPSAVHLAHPEPQQWPVAHVVARRDGDGRVDAVALVGSLGRMLESNPGEPGYESGRVDPSRRSDAP